jgi:hypothetical protein
VPEVQFFNGVNWVGAENFAIADGEVSTVKLANGAVTNEKVSNTAAIALSKLASGSSAQIIVCNSSGVPSYVTLGGDATITTSGQLVIGGNTVTLGTDTTGGYVETILGTANQVTTSVSAGTGGETASVTLSLPQNIHTAANPTFAGATLDAVQIGITTANEIDTTSGNLILDSTGGTVNIDDILTVSGSAAISGAASVAGVFTAAGNVSVGGTVTVTGNVVSHAVPETAASLTNAIDGKIVEVSASTITLTTTGGSWVDGTQFTVISTNASGTIVSNGSSGTTTFRAAPPHSSGVKLRTLYSSATFIYQATGNYWYIIGDLSST